MEEIEEWFQPPISPHFTAASPIHHNQQTPIPPPSHHRLYRINEDNVALQFILSSPSKNHNDTYIVQMPKDRIYKVPPHENAIAIKRQCLPVHSSKRRCTPRGWYVVCSLAVIAILSIIFYLIFKFTLTPHNPLFIMKSFTVMEFPNPNPKSSYHHGPPMYHVGIQATNPNAVNSLVYLTGTDKLHIENNEVARGTTPTIIQAAKEIDDFEVMLFGRAGEVPEVIQQIVNPNPNNKKDGSNSVNLNLTMSFVIKKETWLMTKKDLVIVNCEFVVERVSQGLTSIKSQTCGYM